MEIKLGEIYTRRSDGGVYRVKMIDGRQVVLESEDKNLISITDIRGLQKAYSRKESPTPQ